MRTALGCLTSKVRKSAAKSDELLKWAATNRCPNRPCDSSSPGYADCPNDCPTSRTAIDNTLAPSVGLDENRSTRAARAQMPGLQPLFVGYVLMKLGHIVGLDGIKMDGSGGCPFLDDRSGSDDGPRASGRNGS
jgi:hypothetical protein